IYQHYGDRVKPYVILATFVVTGENLDKTNQLLNAFHLWLIRIFYANQPKSYPSIDTVINRQWTDRELKKKSSNANRVISGSPYQVATQLKQLKKDYHVDEIMILPHVYGEANRKRLLELVMEYSKT
ncbi:MAG: LLM class flavin-dependent oxidoreductase, partial [Staphylococcus warneri]|nr:LLM class flavin-dependent oxidoreductase [Staphylococcus warneri]